MLQHLAIKNFAIIKSTEIDFKDGMTVVTGETGAGKSILIDALSFVLGTRLEKTFLNDGEITEVLAIFDIRDNEKVKRILEELFIEDLGECTIRRVVRNEQSRLFINGTVVKAAEVKRVSDNLINIYSQNSHQDLLDIKAQLNLLDSFANNSDLLKKIAKVFFELQKVDEKIVQAEMTVETKKNHKELLEYKLDELIALDLLETEFDDLVEKQKDLSSIDDKVYVLSSVCEGLYDSEQNVISIITELERNLSKFSENKDIKNLYDLISQTKVYAQEGYDDAKSILDSIEQNPEELIKVEQRMSAIYEVARKHKVEPNYLYSYIRELQDELDSISQENEGLKELLKEKNELEKQYFDYADELSISRQKAAKNFSKQVENNIRSLNMPKAKFDVEIKALENKTAKGLDSCEFVANLNLGERMAPVKRVASGGELSRIGLAIQAVSAEKKSYPTLVFDEVDVGISGATAEIVGKLLKELSHRLQILCITHQAQVAAQGDIHLHVVKEYLSDHTLSKIVELSLDERVTEIAKIVGGVDISENTLKHARELLKNNL
ncbi:DNA repair protein RecN [Francisella frigiditurris]|uniref:DNA repair protein RecN n=1 Tax=Francisella frigiditurris TaxID=1542390 RepID=A0A1J0KT57_9GAMM|nr:DNA repair protein RecN [Francisella frigiditurris]APC96949.1 DNA repair protein RecN [Francisella frigiditurris]